MVVREVVEIPNFEWKFSSCRSFEEKKSEYGKKNKGTNRVFKAPKT